MVRVELGMRKKRDQKTEDEENGFGNWGSYMASKRAKLMEQFHDAEIEKVSDIFAGVAIHVNGLTRPPIDDLKKLMAAHGGLFHAYQTSSTTHVLASNLCNVKIKHLGNVPIVRPKWITDSVNMGKLLDYRHYLLYTNQKGSQPGLKFPIIEKSLKEHIKKPEVSSEMHETHSELSKTEIKTEEPKISNSGINSPVIEKALEKYLTPGVSSEVHQTFSEPSKTEFEFEGSKTGISASVPNKESDHTHTSLVRDYNLDQYRGITKTASDPKFLEEFYNNSRLHLISTLGAEYKQLVNILRESSDGSFPGKQKLIGRFGNKQSVEVFTKTVVMHIDMDCFFVSVGLKSHPELRGQPVAITHARNGQLKVSAERKAIREQEIALYTERLPVGVTSRVDRIDAQSSMSEIASCSYEARKCGIKNGMFLGQAIKMCPELKTLPYDFDGYKEVSHILYKIIATYTLDIEAVSCDEMYVDVTNILRETGLTVDQWATVIRNEIMEATGCPCSTGFGANRLQARLATRKAKPAGQYYLEADDVETYMREIPLADLPGVGRATLAKLRNVGLNTCGDVQVASIKVIQSEIGQKAGETLKDQARGIDNRPLSFTHERKSVSAEVNYGIRFKTMDECYSFLQSLSEEVYTRLSDINMRARCLTLKLLVRAADAPVETAKFLGHGICDSFSKSTTSNIIFSSPQTIFKEVRILYDKMNQKFADLRGVGIQLTKLEKYNHQMNNALSNFLKQSNVDKVSKVESGPKTEHTQVPKSTSVVDIGVNTDPFDSVNLDRTEFEPRKSLTKSSTEKSRRGRPKGSKNGVTKSKNNLASINQYFGKSKKSEQCSKIQTTRPQVNISMDFLKELPEDIRKEIIIEYQLDVNKIKTNFTQSTQISETKQLTNHSQNSQKATIYLSTPGEKISPFSSLTFDQIKPIIMQWIQSEDLPNNFDIEMIAQHFKQMAINRKIEELMRVFNFLHRIFSNLNCFWHRAYYTIVNITQEGMVARYGNTLYVKRSFDCCQI